MEKKIKSLDWESMFFSETELESEYNLNQIRWENKKADGRLSS